MQKLWSAYLDLNMILDTRLILDKVESDAKLVRIDIVYVPGGHEAGDRVSYGSVENYRCSLMILLLLWGSM